MAINTKYDIEDEVWTLVEKKARKLTISEIYIIQYKDKSSKCDYRIVDHEKDFVAKEIDIFPSKEELLKSL